MSYSGGYGGGSRNGGSNGYSNGYGSSNRGYGSYDYSSHYSNGYAKALRSSHWQCFAGITFHLFPPGNLRPHRVAHFRVALVSRRKRSLLDVVAGFLIRLPQV